VYNSEILCVEESMHVKFDGKEPRNETPEQDESCADIQVTEDTPEPDHTSDSEVSPEAEPTSEADPTSEAREEVASDEAQNGSQQENQSKNTFKHKSSHLEDQIIGNKDSPRRTRSYFRQEESMIGFLSVIEPATVDEALSDDGWILACKKSLINFKEMMCGIWYRNHLKRTLLEQNGYSETS